MGSDIRKHVFDVKGTKIPVDAEGRVSLTALWVAAGRPKSKDPNKWLTSETAKEFVASLAEMSKPQIRGLLRSVRGNTAGRGTWGHWQIALAYAEWLSPEFHQYVNEGFRQWQEEERDPGLKLDRSVDAFEKRGKAVEWIEARFKGKLQRNALTATLKSHQCRKDAYPKVTDIGNLAVVGKTAKEFRERSNLPATASTRDNMSASQLAWMMVYETSVQEKVVADAAIGDEQCVESAMAVGKAIQPAVKALRELMSPAVS